MDRESACRYFRLARNTVVTNKSDVTVCPVDPLGVGDGVYVFATVTQPKMSATKKETQAVFQEQVVGRSFCCETPSCTGQTIVLEANCSLYDLETQLV